MQTAARPEKAAWIARLGLVLLVATGISMTTGAAQWVLHDLRREASPGWVTLLHIYAGAGALPFLAAKIWASWSLLPVVASRPGKAARRRLSSTALVLTSTLLYLSGALLAVNLSAGGNGWLKDLHRYSVIVTAALLTLHIAGRIRSSWALAGRMGQPQPAGGRTGRLYSRRAIAALGLTVGLAWLVRTAFPARASEDPNDFPVTNFGLNPQGIDLSTWRLEVRGAVERPFSLTYEQLLQLPRERHRYPLVCVTGWSTEREWEGVPVTRLLEMAGPFQPDPTLRFLSTTGYESNMSVQRYTRPGAMVATHVGGVPFTHDHGFPSRLLVPGVVGEECVKWLGAIEVL